MNADSPSGKAALTEFFDDPLISGVHGEPALALDKPYREAYVFSSCQCPWNLRLRELRKLYPEHQHLKRLGLMLTATFPMQGQHAQDHCHSIEAELGLPLSAYA